MKSAVISFVLTAALLSLDPGLLPSRAPAPDSAGFAERHAHENSAALEARLGIHRHGA